MTEPESEAESMSEEEEDDCDETEFKIYYQDLLDVDIPPMKVRCKGCGKKLPFEKPAGIKTSDSKLAKEYYEHCLFHCPPFITAGEMKTCIPCRLYFMNQEAFDNHKNVCVKQKKQVVSSGKGKVDTSAKHPPVSARTRQVVETARRARDNDDEEEDENEGEKMAKELLDMNFGKLVNEAESRLRQAAQTKRPGPASKTQSTSHNENQSVNGRAAGPSAIAQAQVLAERKLSGKDLSQLSNALKKRNSSAKTPSALARKKEEKKRKREERSKKRESSRLTDSSSSGSGSSDDSGDDEKKEKKRKRKDSGDREHKKKSKKRRKKKKPFDPEKAKYRTFDTSSSELDPDEEEFPEFVYDLKDVELKSEEYFNYIPKVSQTCARFNDSIKCPGCKEPFACYKASMDPVANGRKRKEGSEVPSPAYYKHCLRECKVFHKMAIMRKCNECCHRFIDHNAYLLHNRGGKNSICHRLKKTLLEPLKFKWPTVARDTYFKALEIGQKKKNSKMCCPGCGDTYKCWKRGFDHIPDLVMMMHCFTDCVEYKKLGLIVTCPTCSCEFMDQKWLDDHDCDKAPVSGSGAAPAKRPPLGGKSIPESSTAGSSSSRSKTPTVTDFLPTISATSGKGTEAKDKGSTRSSPKKPTKGEQTKDKEQKESSSSSSSASDDDDSSA